MSHRTNQTVTPSNRRLVEYLRAELAAVAADASAIRMLFLYDRRILREYQDDTEDPLEGPSLAALHAEDRVDSELTLHLQIVGAEITLDWFPNHSPNGKPFVLKHTAFGFHMATLLAHARDWERDLVRDVELSCRKMRKDHHRLVQAIQAVGSEDGLDEEPDAGS